MKKTEKTAFVRLVRHMQQLQRRLAEPTSDDATDDEVLKLFELFWEWGSSANQPLPSKHLLETLVGLMRGCDCGEYGYISGESVARIIRAESKKHHGSALSVSLNKDADTMTDAQLYRDGRWNYQPTPMAEFLRDLHTNPRN